jgi:two-component system OmpR family sensor kinase
MRPRSLGARSIVAAALAIVLALAVVSVVVDVLVGRQLHRSLDRSLRDRATEVAELSASAPALLTSPGALDVSSGGQQLSVEVVDRRRRIVARSLALGGRVLPVETTLSEVVRTGRGRYVDATVGSDPVRIYVAPLADAGGPAAGGAVAVAASTEELSDTLEKLRAFLLLATVVAAGAAALALALLMRRALTPLARLARSAAEIERTGDPSLRLAESPGDDEIARLARTLNAMLASLERARESERRFLADASHELRTPLTALLGNVSYLARHGASAELVEELESDASRLARLADDLLVLSSAEASPVPDDVVRLDELAGEVGKRDPRVDVVAPVEVSARGDRAALERALVNLVQNASRYGPKGGRVTVELAAANGLARLSVSDSGPGLAPDDAERAFERFWRKRGDLGGSGLGLAIVRATAERHGGRAYAEGARFTIELPALRDFSQSSATRGREPSKGSP